MDFGAPTAFVVGVTLICAVTFVLPLRIEGREDYLASAYAATVAGAVIGPEAIVLVWVALLLSTPLLLARHAVVTRELAASLRGALASFAYGAVTALALSAGFVTGIGVYSGLLGRTYPMPIAGSADIPVAVLSATAAWAGTMAVRLLTLRMMTGSLLPRALDPFDSVLIPYVLPVIGGLPLVVASIATYDAADPWVSLAILSWCFPLYGASWYELHRRSLALDLRREVLARQRLAAIGEVSARIVHQSRHQVGLMGWSVHRLRALIGAESTDREAEYAELDALDEAKDRLSEMLASELLHESAPEPSDSAPVRVTTLADAIDDVVRQLGEEAARSGLDLRTEVDPDLGARWVASGVRDVVFNLVDNAIDAAASAVELHLHHSTGDWMADIEITVIDDGPGVADGEVDRSFEPFFTTKVDGTGMGLAIADALVAELGGTIRYERRGERTAFVVVLRGTPA